MIRFNSVTFGYGETPILQNVSFYLPPQGAVSLFGPSGCGKTTLLRLIAGLEQPTAGTVHRPADCRIAMLFQENRLLPWLTVAENVALALSRKQKHRVTELLEAVSLSDAATAYPNQLSGGMQRRVAIARTLAYDGDIVILDEPFTGLDSALRDAVGEQIRQRCAEKLIVMVTHAEEEAPLLHAIPQFLTPPLQGQLF